ncbi:DUF3048 domain-containing protein [Lachnobacterium bovis]|uniref:DUF3048 domain-containing protein n=1 Tax=Lachnobacterium bovis TaxID=140626 RepID=A0A1H9PZS2_9FIRM|nr:DUF3048 domain-containing protein [Lachnobacterium bovis]SER53684.1 Protein of unknown function [Lachnobacterium bovis]
MIRKYAISLLIMAFCGSLLGGCKKEEEQKPAQIKVKDNSSNVEQNHKGKVQSFYTGEWIDKKIATKRPVAIMIENTHACLPQYGLSKGDIIYECPVEAGITRLMLIMQDYSNCNVIGNIRSARDYFVQYAKEQNAVFFHYGESRFAVDALNEIDNVDGIVGNQEKYFDSLPHKKAPHHIFTSTHNIEQAFKNLKYSNTLDKTATSYFKFAKSDNKVNLGNGKKVEYIKLYYSNAKPYFEYNKALKLYYRGEYKSSQIDALSDSTLAVKNIIIQECECSVRDKNDGSLKLETVGTGTGKYITNGHMIDINWKYDIGKNKTCYYDSTGKEITLNPGKTWVCISEKNKSKGNTFYTTKKEYESKK